MKWNKFIKNLQPQGSLFFEEIVGKIEITPANKTINSENQSASKTELVTAIQFALDAERREIIIKHLQKCLTIVLGREPGAGELSRGFMDLGVDSLMSIEFRNKLKKDLGEVFGKALPPTLVYDYPNINLLADFLLKDVIKIEKASQVKEKKTKKLNNNKEPIAIVGASCRLPGGVTDLESYWKLLHDGVDAIETVPKDRWDIDTYFDADPDANGKMMSRFAGFMKNVDLFDAEFFEMSGHEAGEIDPQQRILLESTWEALEMAGENPEKLRGSRTGVYIGGGNYDYGRLHNEYEHHDHGGLFGIGTLAPALAGRISYFFGFQGPSFVIDTACSSSLLAIHQACKSLKDGETDMCVAGGVNVMLTPDVSISFSHAGMLSPDGRCFTFDDRANGYVRAEGCGVVILKRLSDAIENGDQILALVRGTAANQDGRSGSLTAPNGPSQEALIKEALDNASVLPAEISYFEAHGTGTPLGDPIEVYSLGKVLKEGRDSKNPLFIGSHKTNIGHAEAAAGVAGVLKIVLSLNNKQIPPHLNFKNINPKISLEEIPAQIPVSLTDWKPVQGKRIACISSYGFTGTNVNAVIEEAPQRKSKANKLSVERPVHLLCLSGRTENGLNDLVERYLKHIESGSNLELADMCFSAGNGRAHFTQRLAVIGRNLEEISTKLKSYRQKEVTGVIHGQARDSVGSRIVFLFSGQGSQYFGMGKELYETQPTFKRVVDQCAKILNSYLALPLLSVMWGENKSKLDETAYTQPALFVLEYALAELWKSWGVEASAVMGHSVGELVAACVAGVFSLEDGLKLISKRSSLMQKLGGDCGMGVVSAPAEEVLSVIQAYGEKLSIAAYNGPMNTTISGDKKSLREVLAKFEAKGLKVKELTVSHGFHSSQMNAMLEEFEGVANEVKYSSPKLKLISNLTGVRANEEEICKGSYWRNHVREAVKFEQGIKTLWNEGYRRYLEMGPGTTMVAMGQACIENGDEGNWLSSIKKDRTDWEQMLETLGVLYTNGINVDWMKFESDTPTRQKVQLPTYPFQRQRYWIENKNQGHNYKFEDQIHLLLGKRTQAANGENIFESTFSESFPDFLKDHCLYGRIIMPGVIYMEMILAAGKEIFQGNCELRDIAIERPLILNRGEKIKLQLITSPEENGEMLFEMLSQGENEWRTHASGKILRASEFEIASSNLEEVQSRVVEEIPVEKWYAIFRDRGLELGPSFQGIHSVKMANGELLAEIVLPKHLQISSQQYQVHPIIIDCCFQAAGILYDVGAGDKPIYLPVSFDKVSLQPSNQNGKKFWCHIIGQSSNTSDAKTFTSHFVLYDENGLKIGEVKNYTSAPAAKADLMKVLNQAAEFHDMTYAIKWIEKPLSEEKPQNKNQTWIILSDETGKGEALGKSLRSSNRKILSLKFKDEENLESFLNGPESKDYPVEKIIHLWSLDMGVRATNTKAEEIAEKQKLGYLSALNLTKLVLSKVGKNLPELRFVTCGAQSIGVDKQSCPEQAPLWGFIRTLSQEFSELRVQIIDLEINSSPEIQIQNLKREILNSIDETQVAYRLGNRLAARLSKVVVNDSELLKTPLNGGYLITGGLSGLGLQMATWLSNQGAKHLVLMGRSEASLETAKIIENLRSKGTSVRIVRGDVAKEQELALVIEDFKKNNEPELKGIIHAAGVLADATLLNQTTESFEKVMLPKIKGGWNLHKLTRDMNLDFFVLFSSTTSILGNMGQINYGAANAYLDALAHYRRNQGLTALTINWGPWADVGMAKNLDCNAQTELAKAGWSAIGIAEGLELFGCLMNSGLAQVGVLPLDWTKYFENLSGLMARTYLSEFAHKKKSAKQEKRVVSALQQQVMGALENERKAIVTKFLVDHVSKLVGAGKEASIDTSKGLMSIGMDSLATIEFRNRLKKELSYPFPATLLFNYPTIDALAEFLLKSVIVDEKVEVTVPIAAESNLKLKKSSSIQDNEPIAIVGMGCRFPGGANNLDLYWDLLANGKSGIVNIPKERWDNDDYYDADPDAPGKIVTQKGGFFKGIGIDQFDPEFFGISTAEANYADPGVRLLLETAWEALEDAGETQEKIFGGKTGLFVGAIVWSDYEKIIHDAHLDASKYEFFSLNLAYGRLAYFLGAQGPMLLTDTACSSSLVALDIACKSLRSHNCERAIVAGINTLVSPRPYMQMSRVHALSPTGESLTFDENANGYVRGEGSGVVILKRLSDALANGDRIQAVIKGSAIMHGGRSLSPTAPNGSAQEELIRHALKNAGVNPQDVGYVEAHGTGTPLGDPIEMQALAGVMRGKRGEANPLFVSSVKTNFGHTEGAAGIAGIIKTVLAMKHKQIPPHVGLKKINPNINLEEIPAKIPMELTPWPTRENKKRIGGVSSFGITGTIAHVVLEEAPDLRIVKKLNAWERPKHILTISGRNEEALAQLVRDYIKFFTRELSMPVTDICFTASSGRNHFNERLAIVAQTREEFKSKLLAYSEGSLEPGVSRSKVLGRGSKTEEVVFLFSGQGSQYFGMGKELYETQPTFKRVVDQCAKILSSYLALPLLSVMWGENKSKLDETAYTQPALFVLEYALAELWKSWGVEASAVMGHSVGELVAACVAGVFSLEDGLKLISKRGGLMQKLGGDCGMGVVSAPAEEVMSAIHAYGEKLSIAAYNGPMNTTISGDKKSLREVLAKFEAKGLKVKELMVSHGFHSSQMNAMLEEFEQVANEVKYSSPKLKLISNLTGARANEDEICKGSYWRNHVREAVKFEQGIKTLWNEGYRRYLEMGPGTTMVAMGQACIENGDEGNWLSSIKKDRTDWEQMLETMGVLYTNGVNIDWMKFESDTPTRQKVQLPTYPFQRQRYWIEDQLSEVQIEVSQGSHSLLGKRIQVANGENVFESEIKTSRLPYLKECLQYGNMVMPPACFIEMSLAAGAEIFEKNCELKSLKLERQLPLKNDGATKLQLIASIEKNDELNIEILSQQNSQWQRLATGILARAKASESFDESLDEIRTRCKQELSVDEIYSQFSKSGIELGQSFRGLKSIKSAKGELLVEVEIPNSVLTHRDTYECHPILLDQFMQAANVFLKFAHQEGMLLLPKFFEHISIQLKNYRHIWCHITSAIEGLSIDTALSCDLTLYNETSEKIGEVRNIEFAKIKKEDVLLELSCGEKNQETKEWFYGVDWQRRELAATAANDVGRSTWLIFEDESGIGADLARNVKAKGNLVHSLKAKSIEDLSEFKILEFMADVMARPETKDVPISNIVHLWSLNMKAHNPLADAAAIGVDQHYGYESALIIVKNVLKVFSEKYPAVTFVTKGAQVIGNDKVSNIEQAPIWGLLRVLSVEHPELRSKIIDFDMLDTESIRASQVLKEIDIADDETQIVYRSGVRQVARIKSQAITTSEKIKVLTDANYLITGGLGGLGLQMGEWLISQGAKHLILMGRGEPQSDAFIKIEGMRTKGVDVTIALGDVANEKDLARVMATIKQGGFSLRGIIHAAGSISDTSLAKQNWDLFEKVMRPKIIGGWNLHKLTKDEKLDFFVLFSSVASVVAFQGQSNYAAANIYLDNLAGYRRNLGLEALSINWGAWGKVGMGSRGDTRAVNLLEQSGWSLISPEDGQDCLGKLINAKLPQIAVMPLDWRRFFENSSDQLARTYFSEFAVFKKKVKDSKFVASALQKVFAVPEGERIAVVTKYLIEQVTKLVGSRTGSVDTNKSLISLGMDSLGHISLRSTIKKELNLTFPMKVLSTHSTIESLAVYLVEMIKTQSGQATDKESSKKVG